MISKFVDDWNLISAKPYESYGENSLLYSIEHFFLTKDNYDRDVIAKAIMNCRVEKGIYLQHPSNMLVADDYYMSRDQLISIFAFSFYNNLYFHKEIWQEIKRQLFRYDNMNPPKTMWQKIKNVQFIAPQDLIFYGNCAGCFLWKLLLPILWFSMFFSILSKWKVRPEWYKRIYYYFKKVEYTKIKMIATDGKLLTFVRCAGKKWNFSFKIFSYFIKKKFGSWNAVFRIFFPYDDHPNVKASMGI